MRTPPTRLERFKAAFSGLGKYKPPNRAVVNHTTPCPPSVRPRKNVPLTRNPQRASEHENRCKQGMLIFLTSISLFLACFLCYVLPFPSCGPYILVFTTLTHTYTSEYITLKCTFLHEKVATLFPNPSVQRSGRSSYFSSLARGPSKNSTKPLSPKTLHQSITHPYSVLGKKCIQTANRRRHQRPGEWVGHSSALGAAASTVSMPLQTRLQAATIDHRQEGSRIISSSNPKPTLSITFITYSMNQTPRG